MNQSHSNLRLASYNIHRCIGTDGVFSPERIITVLKQLDADVIALQEVETPNGEGLDLLEEFGHKLEMQAFAGLTMFNETSNYGNALLTKLHVDEVHREDISIKDREPRGALCVKTKIANKSVRIIATHLGLLPVERRDQVKRLLTILEQEQVDISILMGDLNEWFLWGRPLKWLRRHFGNTMEPATFPSKFPFLALDRIWVEPAIHVTAVSSFRSSLTKLASDHLPLTATITIK